MHEICVTILECVDREIAIVKIHTIDICIEIDEYNSILKNEADEIKKLLIEKLNSRGYKNINVSFYTIDYDYLVDVTFDF